MQWCPAAESSRHGVRGRHVVPSQWLQRSGLSIGEPAWLIPHGQRVAWCGTVWPVASSLQAHTEVSSAVTLSRDGTASAATGTRAVSGQLCSALCRMVRPRHVRPQPWTSVCVCVHVDGRNKGGAREAPMAAAAVDRAVIGTGLVGMWLAAGCRVRVGRWSIVVVRAHRNDKQGRKRRKKKKKQQQQQQKEARGQQGKQSDTESETESVDDEAQEGATGATASPMSAKAWRNHVAGLAVAPVSHSTRILWHTQEPQPLAPVTAFPVLPACVPIGLDHVVRRLEQTLIWPIANEAAAACLGLGSASIGLLLHGPPGCGKTMVVRYVAQRHALPVVCVTPAQLRRSQRQGPEAVLSAVFQRARRLAREAPLRACIVFLDEVDALCPRRADDTTTPEQVRIVAQLLTLMDGFHEGWASNNSRANPPEGTGGRLLVIGATNRPHALDPALRRPGRLDCELAVTPPNAEQRRDILRAHVDKLPLHDDVCLDELARQCTGYVGADLAALGREAALIALRAGHTVTGSGSGAKQAVLLRRCHFQAAMCLVGPSAGRSVLVNTPHVAWDDVGGLQGVKARLRKRLLAPTLRAERYARFGVFPPRGVLLHGPPGCGKTRLARAIATQLGGAMVALSGASLYSMYVGEAEANVRQAFAQARALTPCVLLLDELDALVGARSEHASDASPVAQRVLSTLLNEMDGIATNCDGVIVVGTTNRKDLLDAALLRPGRMDLVLRVEAPNEMARIELFHLMLRNMPCASDVDVSLLASKCDGFSAADVESVCREAAMLALRERLNASQIGHRHLLTAAKRVGSTLQLRSVTCTTPDYCAASAKGS